MIVKDLSELVINKLSQKQFDNAKKNGLLNDGEIYLTPYKPTDLSNYVTKDQLTEEINNINSEIGDINSVLAYIVDGGVSE